MITQSTSLPEIIYHDTIKPFYGSYPYKISIRNPPDAVLHTLKGREKRMAFYKKVKQQCANVGQTLGKWRSIRGDHCVNLFFTCQDDVDIVVDMMREHVTDLHRPRHANDHQTMLSSQNVNVRKRLYWDNYRYCVIFKYHHSYTKMDELDSWVETTFDVSGTAFPGDNPNAYFSYSDPRRLYLNSESDVLMVKFAYTSEIKRIEKVILKKECDDEHQFDQATH